MTRPRKLLSTSIVAVFAAASAQDAVQPDRSTVLLTVKQIHTENGIASVDVTLTALVQFDQPFSVMADVHGNTLRAEGLIRGKSGQPVRAEIHAMSSGGMEVRSNLMMQPDQPLTLGRLTRLPAGTTDHFEVLLTKSAD